MSNLIRNNAHYLFYLFAVLITVYPKALGLMVVLLLLTTVFVGVDLKYGSKRLLNFKTAFPWMIFFLLMHFVGLSNTENTSFAWMDIGMKISMVLLPLVFAFGKWKIEFIKLFDFFLIGSVLSVFIALVLASIHFLAIREYHVFSNSNLSYSMHRSYWATYMLIAFVWAFIRILTLKEYKVLLLIGMLVLLIGVILSGSKAGILIFILVFTIMLVYSIISFKQWKMGAVLLIVFVFSSFLLLKFVPSIKVRFEIMLTETTKVEKKNYGSIQSTIARILVWDSSIELIKENPIMGVGTGDIKDQLKKRNLEKGYTGVARENLNCHNQFFNTQLAIGVFGTLFLLGMLIAPFIYQTNNNRFFIRIVLLICIFSLIPESFLETQAGIIPIAFLLSFFGYYSNAQDKESKAIAENKV